MHVTDENRDLILGALDSLGIALTLHEHTWSEGEKEIYEQAIEALTGSKELPRGSYFEKAEDEGEEWKGGGA